jgi:hypothetical protein
VTTYFSSAYFSKEETDVSSRGAGKKEISTLLTLFLIILEEEAEDLKREEADYYCESPIDWNLCNQSFFHDAGNYSRGSRSKNEL